jgi:hypothetical protein
VVYTVGGPIGSRSRSSQAERAKRSKCSRTERRNGQLTTVWFRALTTVAADLASAHDGSSASSDNENLRVEAKQLRQRLSGV